MNLLESPEGPILADYPEDAPPSEGPATLACPISFPQLETESSDVEKLRAAFMEEISHMRPWYDMAVKKRTRTTVGVAGLEPLALGNFIGAFLDGAMPESPREEIAPPALLKLGVEDLKAYYFEAVTAQPGQENADSQTLAQWFWRETVAGKVLVALRNAHKDSEDEMMQRVVVRLLVPRAQSVLIAS